tara:strand:- start:2090 stop:2374 length:285 start_codon:yes stop_codon:yes gene_type:complete
MVEEKKSGYHPGGRVRGRPVRRGRPTQARPTSRRRQQVASKINAPGIRETLAKKRTIRSTGRPSTRRKPPSRANPISRFNQASRRAMGRFNRRK